MIFKAVVFSIMIYAESGALVKLKYHEAAAEMMSLGEGLEAYKKDCRTYPKSKAGLEVLLNLRKAIKDCPEWRGPYIDDLRKDPFGQPYIYESNGSQYRIKTLGRDHQEGGESMDWDLIFYSKDKKESSKVSYSR